MFEKLVRFETSEQSTPGTAYYRATYEQVKAAVFATADALGAKVKSNNDTHKEFLIKHRKYEIMVTAFNITMLETAVDLVVMGSITTPNKKIALSFFNNMKKHVTLK